MHGWCNLATQLELYVTWNPSPMWTCVLGCIMSGGRLPRPTISPFCFLIMYGFCSGRGMSATCSAKPTAISAAFGYWAISFVVSSSSWHVDTEIVEGPLASPAGAQIAIAKTVFGSFDLYANMPVNIIVLASRQTQL